MSNKFDGDPHFTLFAKNLENAIAGYSDPNEKNRNKIQKKQFEDLIKLEKQFKKALQNHKWGRTAVKALIDKYNVTNVLCAQPLFRERKKTFGQKIIKIIKKRDIDALLKFNINYQFVNFILKQHRWGKKSDLVIISKQIIKLRDQIITENMPLVISKARAFWLLPLTHI